MGRLEISGWGCVALALALLVLPLQWLAAAVTAAAVHELCHAMAVRLLGGRIYRMALGSRGAVMELGAMPPGWELLAAAAGPAGSFLLLLTARHFPRLALCGLVQGCYNLLPIFPLDGGRVLYRGLELWLPEEKAARITRIVGLAAGVLASAVLLRWRAYPGALLVFAAAARNIPCKDGKLRVQ